jgi:hypothetical protein
MLEAKTVAKLNETILTTEEATDLLEALKSLKAATFRRGGLKLSSLEGKVGGAVLALLKSLAAEALFPQETQRQTIFLTDLKNYLESRKSVRLTISFEPSRDFLKRLHGFLAGSVGPNYLLDIYVKPEIVAGVVIEFEGKYRDYSLAKVLEELESDQTFAASLFKGVSK